MPSFYAFSILLSAFLLFQVQPMIGKAILPWFGGTPAVWSTTLLFFQTLLIGGYAYAYWLLLRVRQRRQAWVHIALLGLSAALLVVTALSWPSPLTPGAAWRPESSALPVWEIFKILAVAVGIPYFLLSSNSTLMQAWFGRENPGRTPYRLYALSNLGSLAALLSYPFLFEPALSLRAHAYLWTAGFVLYAAAAGYLALRQSRLAPADEAAPPAVAREEPAPRPAAGLYPLWIALAAAPSALLIAVTSQITQEVAVIPFLWVLPLAVYLLTFILAFSGGRFYSRPIYAAFFFAASLFAIWMQVNLGAFSVVAQIAAYTLLLFLAGMICHNELYRLRPHANYLPAFYLLVAVGGAAGGSFATLLAPVIFQSGLWELQWTLVVVGGLLTLLYVRGSRAARPAPAAASRSTGRHRGGKRAEAKAKPQAAPAAGRILRSPAVILSAVALALLTAFTVLLVNSGRAGERLSARNFYGIVRVWDINTQDEFLRGYQLTHGRTVHGSQFANARLRPVPTTFYSHESGVGLAINSHPARPDSLRVGAVGLGVGVIATYGQPGDVFRFYEINPEVIAVAKGQGGYFTFLSESPAEIQVVEGDGRVSLERELEQGGSQQFDLLVLDAFSGDAVPMHLLTREAFEVYWQHLKPDGILAIHVSNRYFALDRQVYRLTDEVGLQAVMIEHRGDGLQSYDSQWMLLAREGSFLSAPLIAGRASPRPTGYDRLRVWTDDYSNLLSLLR